MEIQVVVPSHKRADRVSTTLLVPWAKLCVPESQADAYRVANPGIEIIEHPDSIPGLCRKRDWIYRRFGNVLMLDDDLTGFNRLYTEPGEAYEVDPATAYEIIQRTGWTARQVGAYLWGFAHQPNPVTYKSQKPFVLTGYVTGCAMGMLSGSKLYFDPAVRCNEDYWVSLLNAYYHRRVFKDMRFCWLQKDTFKNRGGLSEIRNLDVEREDFEYLRRVFGDVVELKKPSSAKKSLRHPFEKQISLPY